METSQSREPWNTQIHPLVLICIWAAFLLGGLICVTNFSFPVCYYLKVWRKQPMGQNVSPIPILGSLIVSLTLKVLGSTLWVKIIGYVLITIDMGGILEYVA